MKTDLVLHEHTEQFIDQYEAAPTQGLLIAAASGSGKKALADRLVEIVLHDSQDVYIKRIAPEKATITIETIRGLEHFLSSKVPSQAQYNRAVIMYDADAMTLEAQNSLLKMLEEPPQGTLFILTASNPLELLPTIRSRVQTLTLRPPTTEHLQQAFQARGKSLNDIARILRITGARPGLASALLNDDEHPLLEAVTTARSVLAASPFERLLLIDGLSKQKELAINTLNIMQQMASLSLESAGTNAARWQSVLTASYKAANALQQNGQAKLALLNFVMQLT